MRRIEDLAPGDVIVVRPQEVVPADACLLDAHGRIDLAFVTGEQHPVPVQAGDTIGAGARIVGEALRLQVRAPRVPQSADRTVEQPGLHPEAIALDHHGLGALRSMVHARCAGAGGTRFLCVVARRPDGGAGGHRRAHHRVPVCTDAGRADHARHDTRHARAGGRVPETGRRRARPESRRYHRVRQDRHADHRRGHGNRRSRRPRRS